MNPHTIDHGAGISHPIPEPIPRGRRSPRHWRGGRILPLLALLALTACDPPEDTPECAAAKGKAILECCSEPSQPFNSELSSAVLPTSCDCTGPSCVPSGFMPVFCIPKPNPMALDGNGSSSCPDPALLDEGSAQYSQTCVDSLSAAHSTCEGQDPLSLVKNHKGHISRAHPYYESVVAWASQFDCDPLSSNDPVPLVDPITEQSWGASFEYEADGLWLSPEPKNDPTPPAVPVHPFSQADDPNVPIEIMRTEIPGNFVRYHLAQAAFAQVFSEFTEQGAECDAVALRCEFDPMTMVDWTQILQDVASGDGLSWSVQQEGDRYVISEIQFSAVDPDSFSASGTYHGSVSIRTQGKIVVDFRNAAVAGFLPLHDPRSANGYATSLPALDARGSYLGSTQAYFDIPKAACEDAQKLEYPDTDVKMHDKYYTYVTPYRCSCESNDADENYCVADPYPRAHPIAIPGEPHVVYCSAKEPLAPNPVTEQTYWVEWNGPTPLPQSHVTEEIPLDGFAASKGMSGGQVVKLKADLRDFACNGRWATRLMIGDQTQEDPDLPVIGEKVSSAVALQAGLLVEMPDVIVEVEAGPMDLNFDIGVHLEKWIEDNIPAPFSWMMEWFLEIFEGMAEMLFGTAMMFLGDEHVAELGDQQVLVHGLLSHGWQETPVEGNPQIKVVTPELEVGLRRIASNVVSVDFDLFNVEPEFTVYECNLGSVGHWLPENPLGALMQVFSCGVPMVHNIANFVSFPIRFLISEISDLVFQAILEPGKLVMNELVSTVSDLEDDNNIGDLIADTMRGITLIPYYMQGDQVPGNAPSELGINVGGLDIPDQAELLGRTLPPPWSQLCLGAADASFQCMAAKLFVGSANPYNPQIDVVRMGAKTHYRSFQDITLGTPLTQDDYASAGISWDFPPTRYCTPGDTPSSSVAYESSLRTFQSLHEYLGFGSPAEIEQLSNFDEIQVSSVSDPKPLDWRSQCAAFFDFKITSRYLMDAATVIDGFPFYIDLRAQPTKRTSYLVNEVFTCENDADCDLLTQPIHERAELAMCSALADMWYRVCTDPNDCDGGGVAYQNLMGAAIADGSQLQVVADAFAYTEGMTGSGAGTTPPPAALLGLLQGCAADLATEGFTIPTDFVEP